MDHLPTVNLIDLAVLIVIGVNLIIGLRRGLSGELAGLVGIVAALGLGIHFLTPFSLWLEQHTRVTGRAAEAVAFISITIGVIIVAILLRLILRNIMKISFEPSVDKVGGILAAFIRSSVLVLIILMAINMCPHDYLNRKFGEESLAGRFVVQHVMPRLAGAPEIEDLKSEAAPIIKDIGRSKER